MEVRVLKGSREVVRVANLPSTPEEAVEKSISVRAIKFNIPRHNLTVRLLRLPSTNDEELRKIIRLESVKHIPYADEDVILGHSVIEKLEDGYSRVLLAMAREKMVQEIIRAAGEKGLDIRLVAPGSESLFAWYRHAHEAGVDGTTLIINIGSNCMDIDVLEGDKLVFSRGVSYSAHEAMTLGGMTDQIRISINTYHKESGKPVEKIVLTGIAGKADQLKEALAIIVKIPIEIIDQAKGITLDNDSLKALQEASFAELFGIALKPEEIKIDLTPENVREGRRLAVLKKGLIVSAALVVIGAVLVAGIVTKKIHDNAVKLSYVNSEIKKIEPKVSMAKRMLGNMAAIEEATGLRPLSVDMLSEVSRLTPQGILLNMLEYESRKSFTVRGTAPSLSDVFKYVTELEKSQYLENVKVKYGTKRVVSGREFVDFEITGSITVKNK